MLTSIWVGIQLPSRPRILRHPDWLYFKDIGPENQKGIHSWNHDISYPPPPSLRKVCRLPTNWSNYCNESICYWERSIRFKRIRQRLTRFRRNKSNGKELVFFIASWGQHRLLISLHHKLHLLCTEQSMYIYNHTRCALIVIYENRKLCSLG